MPVQKFYREGGGTKAQFLISISVFLLVFSSGCLGKLGDLGCSFVPADKRDHCLQGAAEAAGDDSLCDKIKGADFKASNPPKDKCYLMVANKTGDSSACGKMEGGIYSYEPGECYNQVAINTGDPSLCDKVPAFDGSFGAMNINKANCISSAKASPNYKGGEETEKGAAQNATSGTKSAPAIPKPAASPKAKPSPATAEGKAESAKSAGMAPSDPGKLSDKTGQITQNMPASAKADIKSAGQNVQTTASQSPKVPEPPKTPDEEKGFLGKTWDWVGWGATKAKDITEAAGEESSAGIGAVSTTAGVVEKIQDVTEIRDNFKGVSDKVASGELTDKQGKLIKAGYGLGKAVKWTAGWVPIIGDTVGTVADESMKAGMKFGEKIGAHTTKTNKCIDDPLSDDCID